MLVSAFFIPVPCRAHVLIFGPSKNSLVSSENEAHLGEKQGAISLTWGRGKQANGMSYGSYLLIFQETQPPGTTLTFIKLFLTPS